MQAKDIKGKVDFGIITIREDEFAAVLKRFHPRDHAQGERLYGITETPTSSTESYLVATVRCIEQGTGEAQNVANDLINDLDPNWILLVGIAGGVPASEFTLGDVVAATRLHDFSIEAALQDRAPEYSIAGGPMHKSVQTLLAHLTAMRDKLRGWNTKASIGMSRPSVSISPEAFYGDAEWKDKVYKSINKHFGDGVAPHPPLVTAGSVASSDRLIKDSETIKEWQKAARHIQGIEMELAGVYRAARKNTSREYPILAIRGISDIVGFKRNDDWLEYACNTAAAFSSALLKTTPIAPRNKPIFLSNLSDTVKSEAKTSKQQIRLEEDYEIDHIVFAGHYSRVFKCRRRSTNEICIVKETIADNVCLDALYSLRDLHCSNVAAPREIWESNNKIYEELPYIGGVRLSHAIVRGIGGLTGSVLEGFHLQLIHILETLHKNGIVHRDIHPDNIYLVTKRQDEPSASNTASEIQMWDSFGDSRHNSYANDNFNSKAAFQIAWVLVDCTFATLTSTTSAMRYRHGPYTDEDQELGMATPASDIYALGATIFYGITGKEIPTFKKRKANNDISSFPNGRHPSASFSRHLSQLLSLNPQKRTLSIFDLHEDTQASHYAGTLKLSDNEVILVSTFDSNTGIFSVEKALELYHNLERRLATAFFHEDRELLVEIKALINYFEQN